MGKNFASIFIPTEAKFREKKLRKKNAAEIESRGRKLGGKNQIESGLKRRIYGFERKARIRKEEIN